VSEKKNVQKQTKIPPKKWRNLFSKKNIFVKEKKPLSYPF